MATAKGIIKKTRLSVFSRITSAGLQAIKIKENDNLIGVQTIKDEDIFLTTKFGKSIRFPSNEVPERGRIASGVIGMRMDEEDEVVSMEAIKGNEGYILIVTENGYGKRTKVEEYRVQGRGGKGIITVKVTDRNGPLVYAGHVKDTDEVMLITDQGKIIRIKVKDISEMGRNTQGVRLIQLSEGEKVADVAKVAEEE